MKKTFLFLTALVMSAMMWAETASVELCTNWNMELAYATAYTQDYTIDDLNGGETTMTLAVQGVYRNGATNTYFQMNKKDGYFKNTTALPGKITKIETTWSAAKGPTKCYFATDDEASASDAVVEVSSATSVTYTPDDEQEYYYFNIDVKTGSGSAQMKSCVVYYEPGTPSTVILDSLVIKGTASKMEYEIGEAFDTDGLEVWGIFTKIMKGDSTSQITKGITWTLDPETFEEASDNESVTLVASYKDKTTADTTITGIKVNAPAPLSEYAYIYTSNVELGGSDTVIYDQVKYSAKKMAKNTPATITVPAGTKTLHIHAAAWNKEGSEWTISGLTKDVKITAVADAGVAGSGSVFTLQNDPATNDYFAIETNNNAALTLTITLPKDKRGVIFGINAELQEGAVAAPAFTPSAADFDESVEVSLSCETEGAAIYYTLDGSEPTAASTLYEAAFTLTDTTTVKAIAIKDGKSSAVAEKTYNLVPVYTLAELVAAGAPTEAGNKVILTLNNEVITKLDGTRGVYVKSGDQEVEIFCYDLPATAVVGGTISGRTMGDWVLWGSTWELKPANWNWATFSAPDPTALQDIIMHGNVRKLMHRGHIMILKDNKLFNLQGQLVK